MSGPIRKLLVANRGEIALRVFRAADRLGISTVAVYSETDRDAPFVRAADEAVPLGGRTPAESYLQAPAIVTAAQRAGADAVHPGYGFLSENATFARAVEAAGLTFVGPPAAAIEAMGSKLRARELAVAAGVPVLPGADLSGLPEEKWDAAADEVGWPVLVKASAGGGGRGMRVVRERSDLVAEVRGAAREAQSAFGDATVFVERYLEAPRHIEVQVFADMSGRVVSLFERECSIQRRHQKVIEEAPSPAVDDELRTALGEAAVAVSSAVGYVGAGTVEFVFEDGRFWFLEMNTRLQVEHPVTEAVTGIDVVAWQLRVAQGEPLGPEITGARIDGHAVEARLYAEDPANGWRPTAGRLHRFSVPLGPGVRVDAGVEDGSVVDVDYDSMLAKVVVHGASRAEATAGLARVLRRSLIHGPRTNRDLLVAVLAHPDFAAGRFDTAFLERHPPSALLPPPGRRELEVAGVAAALAQATEARRSSRILGAVPSGFRNNPSQPQSRRYESGGVELTVEYRLDTRPARLGVDGTDLADLALAEDPRPDRVTLVDRGVRRDFTVEVDDGTAFVDGPAGAFELRVLPRFPEARSELAAGSLVAPMPGRVVRVEVVVGDLVRAGQALVVIEAMKMEHRISAPDEGTVSEVRAEVGARVDVGDVLAVIE